MTLFIDGIGTATPEHVIEQEDAVRLAASLVQPTPDDGLLKTLKVLYRRSGVQTRGSVLLDSSSNGHPIRQSFYRQPGSTTDRGPSTAERMCKYEQLAGELALRAAAEALADGGTAPGEVSHLITVSCSGFSAPGIDLELIDRLGLSPAVARTHVGFMGCHGAINALRVAAAFTAADPQAVVLLCATELCSLHQQYGRNSDRVVANSLFADGAAALVGRGIGSNQQPRIEAFGSYVLPNTQPLMQWRIRDHGFEMTLSPQVPHRLQTYLPPWLDGWLGTLQLTRAQIGSWAVHPGGPRILDACEAAMQLGNNALATSRQVLAELGNMSSPTVLFILQRMRSSAAPRPLVMMAFGPGLAIEAALLR